ncbi:MAG: fasciclin domain-containing protein [Bacteroidota bacterium]
MKKTIAVILISIFAFQSQVLFAQCGSSKHKRVKSYVRGHEDVVDIAIGSDVHTTLVAAVKAAGLVNTLKSDGPFTVFAPTNLAFDRLPAGTVETLLKPANKSKLIDVLTYHVIPAEVSATSLVAAIDASGGQFEITTIQGNVLTASKKGNHVVLTDQQGRISKITATDLKATNGYVHVIDTVVLPG